MASQSYMSITGKRQGLISAGCSGQSSLGNKCQFAHQDEIMVLAYSHDMVTGNDGSIAGARGQHRPVMITKAIDKSSPLLASALHEREEVECIINLYRTASAGGQERYYSIHLTGARIAHITQQVPHAIRMNDAEPGISVIGNSAGLGVVPGGVMVGHGVNNIYEGLGNIYHGPGTSGSVGPVRRLYRALFDDARGDIAYYSVDLIASGYGISRKVLKPGAVELFRRDPINYERAFRQTGKLALAFEALVDFLTINTMFSEEESSR